MTKKYKVGKNATEVNKGDILQSPFNDFLVIEVKRWGNHVRIKVEQIGSDYKYDWEFMWSDKVYVMQLA